MNNRLIAAAFAAALASGAAGAATITFEDASMPNEQAYAGPGGGRYWAGAVPPPLGSIAASFTSGGAAFANQRTDWGGGFASWSGFAYADTVDTTTAAFSNEFSAFAGGGAGGSANYGVGYVSNYDAAPRIDFAAPLELAGASFTNTTYAALSMLNGDGFAKRFGGTSGDDADWLKLSVTGLDAQDAVTGTVDVYLADYRFADNSLDYVLDDSGPGQQQLTGLAQTQTPGTAMQQPDPEALFQGCYAAAQRRFGNAAVAGRGGKRSGPHHRREQSQVFQIHPWIVPQTVQ